MTGRAYPIDLTVADLRILIAELCRPGPDASGTDYADEHLVLIGKLVLFLDLCEALEPRDARDS